MTELAERVHSELAPRDVPKETELADIIAVTQELFPGEVEVETGCYETDPPEGFVILTAKGHSTDFAELTKRSLEWHRRVEELQPDYLGRIKLSLNPD